MTVELIAEENPFSISLDTKDNRIQIRSIINDMVAFAGDLVVNNDTAYKKITSLYRQARDWKKTIETKRKELVEPLRKQTAEINDMSKELTDPLDAVISMVNTKTNGYQRMLEDIKKKEEEALRSAAAIFDAEDEIYIPPLEKIIRGDGAVAVTKTEKRFKLVDLSKVPLKYLVIDEKAVMQDIKLGINQIAGLEIFEETTTNLRIR